MSEIKPIDEYIDFVEYPDDEMVIHGLNMDVGFFYISNTYLNGLINYIPIIDAYLINRYSYDIDKFDKCCEIFDNYTKQNNFHFNLTHAFNDPDYSDELLLLCENDYCYMLFDVDPDCSDCSIAKIRKDHFTSKEEACESFYKYCMEFSEDNVKSNAKVYRISPSVFTGWITL